MVSTPSTLSGLLPERPELSPARRRLFETALQLFGEDGYNGVSVRDIARELNQQPTAIYAHVSSKQELLFEIIRIGHEELRDRLRKALLESGSDPISQVRAIVMAHVTAHLEFAALARVNDRELNNLSPEQAAVIDVIRADAVHLLSDVVTRGIQLGVLNPIDAGISVRGIAAMGVRVGAWWTPELGTMDYIAQTHADIAIRMLTRD